MAVLPPSWNDRFDANSIVSMHRTAYIRWNSGELHLTREDNVVCSYIVKQRFTVQTESSDLPVRADSCVDT